MAPPRSSTRRAQHLQENIVPSAGQDTNTDDVEDDLFIDPMLGTPLALYIEKDVQDKETLVQLITVSRVNFRLVLRILGTGALKINRGYV